MSFTYRETPASYFARGRQARANAPRTRMPVALEGKGAVRRSASATRKVSLTYYFSRCRPLEIERKRLLGLSLTALRLVCDPTPPRGVGFSGGESSRSTQLHVTTVLEFTMSRDIARLLIVNPSLRLV
jgi:hypothetical protein